MISNFCYDVYTVFWRDWVVFKKIFFSQYLLSAAVSLYKEGSASHTATAEPLFKSHFVPTYGHKKPTFQKQISSVFKRSVPL